jgi:hypothetical protein
MIKFIKNLFKTNNNDKVKKNTEPDFIRMIHIQDVVNIYFDSLEYAKYNISPLDVDSICKELEMNEEDIAKVHKLIEERIIDIRKKLKEISNEITNNRNMCSR